MDHVPLFVVSVGFHTMPYSISKIVQHISDLHAAVQTRIRSCQVENLARVWGTFRQLVSARNVCLSPQVVSFNNSQTCFDFRPF